jgi:hypothetical protein
MSKRTVIIILIALLPLAFIAGFKCQQELSRFDAIGKPVFNIVELTSANKKEIGYLVSKNWGMTGDHQVTALTQRKPESERWMPNAKTDYIWRASFTTVFYKQVNDRVVIYSTSPPTRPSQFNTNLKIEFAEITSTQFDSLQNLTNTGIKKFDYLPTYNTSLLP